MGTAIFRQPSRSVPTDVHKSPGESVSTRRVGQTFSVGENIRVLVLGTQHDQVKLGIGLIQPAKDNAYAPICCDGPGYFVTQRETGRILVLRRSAGDEIIINNSVRLEILDVGSGYVRFAATLTT